MFGQWLNRRTLLQLGPATLVSFLSATCSRGLTQKGSNSTAQALSPTPACGTDEATLSQTAGPFFTPNSPERQSLLEPGLSGTPMVLTGQVLSSQCVPIAGALVDCWHTNNQGEYDNRGYTFRGHQFTDAEGRYRIETIVPGIYSGRTRHFHIKVQAPNQPVLTTQLYFPEESANQGDFLFNPALVMSVDDKESAKRATFDFILAVV
ncbi:MAG: hypothetical protein ACFB14_15370 [Leptolyngbyaceae cyanobacterium]|mgnify:CR=1 FL=1